MRSCAALLHPLLSSPPIPLPPPPPALSSPLPQTRSPSFPAPDRCLCDWREWRTGVPDRPGGGRAPNPRSHDADPHVCRRDRLGRLLRAGEAEAWRPGRSQDGHHGQEFSLPDLRRKRARGEALAASKLNFPRPPAAPPFSLSLLTPVLPLPLPPSLSIRGISCASRADSSDSGLPPSARGTSATTCWAPPCTMWGTSKR